MKGVFTIIKGSLQEKNGIYQVVYYMNGKPKWKSTGIKVKRGNKRLAEEKMQQILVLVESSPTILDDIKFSDYMRLWLREAASEYEVVTFEGYRSYTEKHLIPYFDELGVKLQKVTIKEIEEYYKFKAEAGRLDGKEGGLSRASIQRHQAVLNNVFKYAKKHKLVTENPCTDAVIPKTAKKSKKIMTFYNVAQCNKLLECIKNEPLYDMVMFTFLYGLRRSELMGLRWCDVNFEQNTIHIQFTVVVQRVVVEKEDTKNRPSDRVYPMLKEIREILERKYKLKQHYMEYFGDAYNDSGYIFTRENGERYYPSYPTHRLEKFLERYHLPHIRWHDLRHSCASVLYAKGWKMKDISDWLGHTDIQTTMNLYGHLDVEYKKELAETIDGLLEG